MTTPDPRHVDVAAYVLGVLNEVDTEAFEFHLVWCETCALELERLLPMATALAEVDGEAFIQSEQTSGDARLLDEMMNVVALRRRRALVQRTLAVAAAFVVVLIVALVGVPGVTNPGHRSPDALATTASPSRAEKGAEASNAPRLATNAPPGIGGPDLQAGEQFSATDAVTKARIDVIVSSMSWGTQLTISLSQVSGPLDCQLFAMDRVGSSTVVASWRVDQKGFGTTTNPGPLLLAASTSVVRADIERLFVMGQAPGGPATLLVSVPL